eukprot:13954136-Heterocapsa_arctica.AAC.1
MPLTAAPASSLDKLYKLSDGDLSVLTSVIQGIPHGSIIKYNNINDLCSPNTSSKSFNVATLISLVLSDYL